MLKIIIVLLYALASSLGMVLIKKGGSDVRISLVDGKASLTISVLFVFGLLLYTISFALWIYILQLFSLTYISPVVYGGVYILITIFSVYLLGESFNLKLLLSCVLIIAGIIMASLS